MPKVYSIDGVTPVVHATAYVHESAILIGDVIVGPGCYIAPSASLRGDFGQIRIGEGSNVQDNCSIHCYAGGETVVGADVSVGHGAVLHGCSVDDHALVGMNAVVMDGATIGSRAIVAALAFVRSDFAVPERTIVAGVPAKIMREITDEETEWMSDANADYHSARERAWASMERVDALHRLDREGPRLTFTGSKPLYQARGG